MKMNKLKKHVNKRFDVNTNPIRQEVKISYMRHDIGQVRQEGVLRLHPVVNRQSLGIELESYVVYKRR